MKSLCLILLFVFCISLKVSAQTNTLQLIGRRSYAPALVIVSHNQEYLIDSASFKLVKQKWIAGSYMGVFVVDPNDSVKYGKAAATSGVNKYRIDDKKYPNAYNKLIGFMKLVGPADSSTYIPKSAISIDIKQ